MGSANPCPTFLLPFLLEVHCGRWDLPSQGFRWSLLEGWPHASLLRGPTSRPVFYSFSLFSLSTSAPRVYLKRVLCMEGGSPGPPSSDSCPCKFVFLLGNISGCYHLLAPGPCSLSTKGRHSSFPGPQLRPDEYVIQMLLQVCWGQQRGYTPYLLWVASCDCSRRSPVSGASLHRLQLVSKAVSLISHLGAPPEIFTLLRVELKGPLFTRRKETLASSLKPTYWVLMSGSGTIGFVKALSFQVDPHIVVRREANQKAMPCTTFSQSTMASRPVPPVLTQPPGLPVEGRLLGFCS